MMEERVPWLRYAWAATLGLSILGLTYVLFDPDLGTSAPLFGEFTCQGKLDVQVANGFGEPYLRTPTSAVSYNATREGELLAVQVTLYLREAGEDWRLFLTRRDEPSEGTFVLSEVTPNTQAYVVAKDVEGKTCAGRSRVIAANATAT